VWRELAALIVSARFSINALQECLKEEHADLKGRALSAALKKKAREIWSEATSEQRGLFELEGNDDIAEVADSSSGNLTGAYTLRHYLLSGMTPRFPLSSAG
jgi:hypothetical protein